LISDFDDMNSANPSTDRLNDPVVLLFQSSPFGTLDAIVQHDGNSVYFYLNQSGNQSAAEGQNTFGTRACWVRNLRVGPLVLNEDEMKQGISPLLPRTHCVHREGQPIPDTDNLQVVWFEEGNGAALIETRSDTDPITLAVIPPWSGLEGFHGYAAECAIESPLCWPMPDNPKLNQRIERALQFWSQWETRVDGSVVDGEDNPFAKLQPEILKAYDERFLNAEKKSLGRKYYSIDGGQFPPRGLVQYQTENGIVLATVGMSVCPQPAVELFTNDPMNYRRIELAVGFRIDSNATADSIDIAIDSIAKQLSGLAAYPWNRFTWFGPGHSCRLIDAAPNCESALLVHDHQIAKTESSQLVMPLFRDDPINLLWLVPITASQQQRLQDQSITANEIIAAI
jgi:hypothetical protein